MSSSINKNYIIFYIVIGLILHLISVYFSYGFYSDDEHFQILEPAAYLLGLNDIAINDKSGYYWEWQKHIRMRPWLQPYLYYHFINFLKFLGVVDSFGWTLIIRLISSMFGYLSVVYLFFTVKNDFFIKNTHFNFLIFFSFWFYPFLHSRTSSENLSLTLFIFSFCILYKQLQSNKFIINYYLFFIASFLMGLGMVTKFNLVFTTIPFFLWMIVFKFNYSRIIIFGSSILIALSFGLFIDYVNWGSFKNTYLQFYKYNIGEYGRLNDYGIDPWWFFITETIVQLAPLLSLLFVISIFLFWIKKPSNVITWITIITSVIISCFGHKEIRYIFPVYIFAPLFISYFFEKFNIKYFSSLLKFIVILSNLLFLSLTLFVPPNTKVGVYKYIFDNIKYNEKLLYIENNPYLINNMEPFIYTKFLPPISEYNAEKNYNNVWIVTNRQSKIKTLENNNCYKKYSTYPEKIFELNKNWKRLNLNWYILYCN